MSYHIRVYYSMRVILYHILCYITIGYTII